MQVKIKQKIILFSSIVSIFLGFRVSAV